MNYYKTHTEMIFKEFKYIILEKNKTRRLICMNFRTFCKAAAVVLIERQKYKPMNTDP
jgi:hypothetical protein